jgi:tRNA U34 5-methylaminomethyl-2-thiouridine-forming methyltransferase MnmC
VSNHHPGAPYALVQLKNGAYSLRSIADAETFHPVVGPVAEADALYVRQLRLLDRLQAAKEEFVVWDVGLGAAANPLTFIAAASLIPARLKVISFDHSKEPLRFALRHSSELAYLNTYVEPLSSLLEKGAAKFLAAGGLSVDWNFHLADFPTFLRAKEMAQLPKPHAIFYDAFSPQKNPAMWTLEVFSNLFRLLDPQRPCAMPTYSRSTMLRVTLLLAGFFVGVGHATGEKEETTIAANSRSLIAQPLDHSWLGRARRSRSAEPLHSPEYRQHPIRPETMDQLLEHPQFR